MIHVDMPYLKYLNLPEEAHFSAHSIIIAGLNEEEDIVYIVDTQFETLQTAMLKELEEARVSKFKPFPPENKWFTFKFPPKLSLIEKAIETAIGKTVETMLNPPIKNLGIKGIQLFVDSIIKWPQNYPPDDFKIKQLYEITYILLEEDGTGGGAFRYLYSAFLKEAGKLLENDRLTVLGERYYEIGCKWTQTARIIRSIPTETSNAEKAGKLLSEIAIEENKVLSSLENTL